MTTHEDVNRRYAELQAILRDVFQADGRGLVEMAISLGDKLPRNLLWELRSIGHIRNQVVHENLATVPKYFEPLCKEALAGLKQRRKEMKAAKSAGKPRQATTPPAAKAATPAKATPTKAKTKPTTKSSVKKKPTKAATAKKRRPGAK